MTEFSPKWFVTQFYAEKSKPLCVGTIIKADAQGLLKAFTKSNQDIVLEMPIACALELSSEIDVQIQSSDKSLPHIEIILHYVVDGGSHMNESLAGLNSLIEQSSRYMKLAIWLDETRANVSLHGKLFNQMPIYKRNSKRICAVIRSAHLSDKLFRNNFSTMLEKRMAFADTMKSKVFDLITKQRLVLIKRSIFEQIGTSSLA